MSYFEMILGNPYDIARNRFDIFDFIREDFLDFPGTDANELITGAFERDTIISQAGDFSSAGSLFNSASLGGFTSDILSEGGNGDDVFIGGDDDDFLFGRGGNDRLEGGAGDDYLGGASGNDLLIGGSGDDRLYAGQGDDVVFGGSGKDIIAGGAGNDYLNGGGGRDEINGQGGNDVLVDGGGFNDRLTGGAGEDIFVITNVTRSSLVNIMDFADGVDMIDLSDFTDCDIEIALEHGVSFQPGPGLTLFEVGGADIYLRNFNSENLSADDILDYDGPVSEPATSQIQYSELADVLLAQDDNALRIDGTGGDDLLEGTEDDDLMIGGAGDDQMFGEGGDDTLFGQSGDDLLVGGTGSDFLSGGGGDDVLIGGSGDDILDSGTGSGEMTGGSGNDIFIFTESNSQGNRVSTRITDFTIGEDMLDLSDFTDCEIQAAIERGSVFGGSSDTALAFPNGQFLILEGVNRGDFSADDIMNYDGTHDGSA